MAFHGPDVYIGGGIIDSLGNTPGEYWKNDVFIPLSKGYKMAAVDAVAVAGDDIYAGGYIFDQNKQVAVYWKNGAPARLSDNVAIKAVCIKKE